jgi:hypothetical protein
MDQQESRFNKWTNRKQGGQQKLVANFSKYSFFSMFHHVGTVARKSPTHILANLCSGREVPIAAHPYTQSPTLSYFLASCVGLMRQKIFPRNTEQDETDGWSLVLRLFCETKINRNIVPILQNIVPNRYAEEENLAIPFRRTKKHAISFRRIKKHAI